MDGFEISGSSSSSPRPRRSSTGSSTASTGWSPPRRGGLAVSGVLGSSAELAPPTVEELRLDPTAADPVPAIRRPIPSPWHPHVRRSRRGRNDFLLRRRHVDVRGRSDQRLGDER
jgi:hypothetical protein